MLPSPDVTLFLFYLTLVVGGFAIGIFVEHWLMVRHELQYLNLVLKQPTAIKQLLLIIANKRDELIIADAQQRIDKRKI
jgi:hypothetical protein